MTSDPSLGRGSDHPPRFPAGFRLHTLMWILRYGLATVMVAAGMGLRLAMTAWVGPGLPTYITFYPAVMVAALLAGFGPGLLATVLAELLVTYWILAPDGFAVASPVDRLGLVIFMGMGLFMSVIAELYRRNRDKAAAYDHELALRELRQEREFLADLLEHAAQPFAVGYPDGRIGRFNRAYEQLTGYSAAELRTLDWSAALTPPEWRESEQQKLEELHRSGRPVRYEKEYLRKDGQRVPVELLVHCSRDANGKPEYYFAFVADITERKRTETELRELSQRLTYHVDHSPLAVIEWGPDMRLTRWSGEAERIFGWKAEEVLGKRMEDFRWIYPEDEPKVAEVSTDLQDGTNPRRFSANRNYRKDGAVVHCEWFNSSLLDESGKLRSILSLVLDVTERKQTEEALRFLVECGTAPADGFFESLARYLAHSAGMDYICIDRLQEGLLTAQTVAIWFDGKFEDNVSYTLKDTPCGDVVGKTICCFPKGVRHLFPKDAVLQEMSAESYVGTTLWGHHGQPIGLIAMIGRRPLADPKLAATILQLVAVRAAGELERRQAEEALQKKQAMLSEAERIANVGCWEWNLQSGIVTWSEQMYRIFDVDPSKFVPTYERFLALIPPEDRLRVVDTAEKAIAAGRSYDIEYPIITSDLTPRRVHARAEALCDETGRAVCVTGTVLDITDRKAAEERLRNSEKLYRAIGESINYGIWVCDPDGRNIYASESFLKLVGLTQEQCSNFGWGDTLHPDDSERTIAAWKECVRTGGTWDIEHRFRGVDGLWHAVLARGVPVRNDQGEIICWAGINLDIDRLKRAEQELRDMTLDVARSNKDLEHYAYVASHDLQEPLRQVAGFMGLLKERYAGKLDARADEFIDFAIDGAKRMSQLINDLLMYSRVTTRGKELELIDTNRILQDVLSHSEFTIGDSGAVVTHGQLPCVRADATQLTQLFQNLIGNAIKFRSQETPRIHVGAQFADGMWQFSVSDNGIGIDPQYSARIFLMFQRLHTREQYPGTGIGLTVCKKIVERHGGRIWVESQPGKGATFYFTLPQDKES